MLSNPDIAQFHTQGFLVLPGYASAQTCDRLRHLAQDHLQREIGPLEYEAEVGYAGAPASLDAPGGRTVRRLRGAYGRDETLRAWASDAGVIARLRQLFGQPVVLNLAHHNCIMSKHPDWGTATGWHRDIRYWSFQQSNPITVWLALGEENAHNGGLWVIPGSHRWELEAAQLDQRDFLREDFPANRPLVAQGVALSLQAGDVLLFDSRLFHAAAANRSGQRKLSVAFAYRGADNLPVPGSRSAAAGEIDLA
ncbi:MAG: phytanoyl-CoA dioxygenase family protein [Pseudomonadota bacterium]|nr:phytanoyl-CoA dioxygenase family protein [Pseudomonadota bacterium]